ncbi:uncharacterized protein F5147DRAFT_820942 [Suillus discolor]|uniref:Uncharacterized protein n=1 Tax=Suillus discolor TaxID=1912936 RepID=A0A9P7EXD2_9AGAM|nr:uncharacterized protein F5147DRAFT_820942 [Suillus discolor]KAG2093761.1 hypothetical protein F5147DRAFT_820942 [Suillus discolor]
MKLCPRDADLLREISSLSTMRVWYPTHLQKMPKVSWSCLTSLAQHHGFHPAAKSIMDYGMQLSTFSEGCSDLHLTLDLPPFTNHLLERASIRALRRTYPPDWLLIQGVSASREKRMAILNELISAVKFIKFFAWGDHWIKRSTDARGVETNGMVKVLFSMIWTSALILASLISFFTFGYQGNQLAASVAFMPIALL